MSIADALRLALEHLNRVEIHGEHNIANMSEAIATIKGILAALNKLKEEKHDGHDKQGENLPDRLDV